MKKVVVAAVLAVLLGGVALADTHGEERCKFCKTRLAYEEERAARLKKALGLTEAQVEKLKQIIREERDAVEKFIKEHKIPLREATKDGQFRKDIYIATVRENAEKRAAIKAAFFEKVFEMLDDVQKKKFIEMMERKVKEKHLKMKESI